MSVTAMPTDADVLQAFRLIDALVSEGADPRLLLPLRSRLAGELLGDAERVNATLADDFELITYAAGIKTIAAADMVVAGVRRLAEAAGAALMWVEFEGLVCSGDTLAAHGLLRKMESAPDGVTITVMRLAIFVHFQDELMTREILYLDPASSQTSLLQGARVPDAESLRQSVDQSG